MLADTLQKRAVKPLARFVPFLLRLLPLAAFILVLVGHAFYIRLVAAVPIAGWAAIGIRDGGFLGLGPYLAAQDYFFGFSYALGAAFGVWAISQFMRQRRAAYAIGTAGSMTLVGGLMASGCFLIGCCGSPMLAVYLAIFGAKAVGIGKPLMAGITLFSTGDGYWYLSHRMKQSGRIDCCADPACSPGVRISGAREHIPEESDRAAATQPREMTGRSH